MHEVEKKRIRFVVLEVRNVYSPFNPIRRYFICSRVFYTVNFDLTYNCYALKLRFSSCCILPRPLLFHLSWKSDSNEYLPMQVCVCALCPVYNVHTLTVRKRVCNVLWLGACFEQCTANRFSTICTRTENSSWFVCAHRTANERMKQKPERTKQNERRIKKSNNNTLNYNWANPEEWSFNVWKCSEWHSNENSTFRFSSGTLLKHGVSVQEGFERFASQADCNVHCVAFLVADIHGCTFILQHYAFTSP